ALGTSSLPADERVARQVDEQADHDQGEERATQETVHDGAPLLGRRHLQTRPGVTRGTTQVDGGVQRLEPGEEVFEAINRLHDDKRSSLEPQERVLGLVLLRAPNASGIPLHGDDLAADAPSRPRCAAQTASPARQAGQQTACGPDNGSAARAWAAAARFAPTTHPTHPT